MKHLIKMMKKLGFYNIKDNYMDIFVYSGYKVKGFSNMKFFEPFFFLALFLLLCSLFTVIISFTISYIFMFLIMIVLILIFNEKYILKNLKKEFNPKMKKSFDIDFKDIDFKEFIEEYFSDIEEKEMSKKDTIEFINNWKKNKKILREERNVKRVEKLTKRLKEINEEKKEISEELLNLKDK